MNRKLWIVTIALVLAALMLAGCGSKDKLPEPSITTSTQETGTSTQAPTEKPTEPPTTAPTEPPIPDDWVLRHLTNPMNQVQLRYYLPAVAEWSEEIRYSEELFSSYFSVRYTGDINDTRVRISIGCRARDKDKIIEEMEDYTPTEVQNYAAVMEEDEMSWTYYVNLGDYNDEAVVYADFDFHVLSGAKEDVKELETIRDAVLSTVTFTQDYEGATDRSGFIYDGSATVKFPESIEFEGKTFEIYSGFGRYERWVESKGLLGDPAVVKCYATFYMPTSKAIWDAGPDKGFTDFTFAGYPARFNSTEFVDYISTEIMFEVNGIYYDMFVSTSPNADVPAEDPAALIAQIKQPDSPYVKKALAFAETMISSAEFIPFSADWIK